VRVASRCALALALITVPVVWVQRDGAPKDDSALVDNPDDGPAPRADELGFSTSRPTTDPSPTTSPSPSTTPSTAAPTPTQTPTPKPRAAAPGGAAAVPVVPVVPAPAPASPTPPPATPSEDPLVVPPPQTALSNDIVSFTNAERAKEGLAPLTVSPCLTDQANYRTAVLVHEDRFEHDPLGPVVDACGMGGGMAENLILGYADAASMVQGWMDSPGHRENLMNPAYSTIGVGCTLGPHGQLCGQIFTG
jgi:uncharacterized protein YkwD